MTTANKAVLAALLAGLASILGDLRGADSTLNFQDWVVVVLAALVTGIGVYLVPNYTRGGVRKTEGGWVDVPPLPGPFIGGSRDRTLHGKNRIRARRAMSARSQSGYGTIELAIGLLVIVVLVVLLLRLAT